MSGWLLTIAFLAGVTAVTAGVEMIYRPAAFIVAGILVVTATGAIARSDRR